MFFQHSSTPMVFRLPTHLESFVPPPNAQVPQMRPWRGSLTLHGANVFARGDDGLQLLRAAAAETEGETRMDLWPVHLSMYITRPSCRLSDLQEWVRRHKPPVCMFMPDHLSDANRTKANEANFRSLSRLMTENQLIAIIPWNAPDRLPGAGIIIFPNSSSTGLLVGAIFLNTSFPDFIVPGASQSAYPSSSHRQYQSPTSAGGLPFSEYSTSGQGNPSYPWQ